MKRAKQSTTSKTAGREESEGSEGSNESGRGEEFEQNEHSEESAHIEDNPAQSGQDSHMKFFLCSLRYALAVPGQAQA